MGRRKAGRRVKRRTQKSTDTAEEAEDLPPRAFVFTKGKVPAALKALVADLKRVMSPNTAQVRPFSLSLPRRLSRPSDAFPRPPHP